LEKIYGLPLLGVVTENPALRRGRSVRSQSTAASSAGDTFQFIRARLRYFNVDRDLRSLAIVSAQSGDGKTTVAHWLADATAAVGSRALLIEADLRRPTLAEELGVSVGPGLTDVLIGAQSLESVVQKAKLVTVASDDDDLHRLDVVVAGALPPNPAEMIESRAMAEVVAQAAAHYEFVVIDTAPLGAVSDCLPLLRIVDGVAVVAGMGLDRRDDAQRLAATLSSVEAPVLGVIANRVKARGSSGYGYGYGYTSNPDLPKLSAPPKLVASTPAPAERAPALPQTSPAAAPSASANGGSAHAPSSAPATAPEQANGAGGGQGARPQTAPEPAWSPPGRAGPKGLRGLLSGGRTRR
jgi:capsular exopolysaccharide synthesis family protein